MTILALNNRHMHMNMSIEMMNNISHQWKNSSCKQKIMPDSNIQYTTYYRREVLLPTIKILAKNAPFFGSPVYSAEANDNGL